MKYVLITFLIVMIVTAGCVALGGSRDETGEVYEGTARGYRGPITVQVRIDGGSIMDIVIIDSREDRFVGGAAIEELIDTVIENNSTDVDVISGATISSKGFLEAVNNAIINHVR